MSDELEREVFEGNLYFNGVNGVTGEYGLPPMPSERLARFIQGKGKLEDLRELVDEQKRKRLEALTDEEKRLEEEEEEIRLAELKDKKARQTRLSGFPVKEGVDPADLAQAGWAVVFPARMDAKRKDEIRKALKPLLDLRREQAGDKLFRIFEGGAGYRPGERKDQFFKRQEPEVRPGPADPAQMPFYVLLVGSPEEIPYKFQFQLDVMRGVGRIDYGDDYEAYHRYAQSIVMAESGQVKLPRRATFFGVANPGDGATQLSASWLVQPLYENLQQREIEGEITLKHPWQLDAFVGEGQATKARLKRLLGGDGAQAPSLLFTASHGVEFPLGHELQVKRQGALLCQDWGGPGRDVTPDDYFAGEDLASEASVLGMMAMFFACYGAGTPRLDQFAQQAFKARAPIAPYGFIGALPRRLLSLGALAVIGHVERAWGYSFVSPGNHLDNQAFVTVLRKLLNGEPVGLATDPSFDLRFADMATTLNQALEEIEYDPNYVSQYELAHMWTSTNDARNYVIVGDPAAKLPVSDAAPEEAKRPAIELTYRAPESGAAPSETTYATETLVEPEPEVVPSSAEEAAAAGPLAFTLGGTITLQPVGAAPAQAFAAPDAAAMAFRWPLGRREESDEEKEERKQVLESIQGFVKNAAEAVASAAKEAATLQIVTYTSDDMSQVNPKDLEKGAQPRAITRISLDGDIKVCVPQKDGEIDKELWELHSEVVQQAQDNRNAMLKIVVDAVSGLVPRVGL